MQSETSLYGKFWFLIFYQTFSDDFIFINRAGIRLFPAGC